MADLYLSPSRQDFNIYYDGSGSEKYYMDLVADAMEPYLVASGISFARSGDDMTLNQVIADSNSGDYRLHLALHSNASGVGNVGGQTGTDVYYYTTSARGREAAEIIASNFRDIYPNPEKVRTVPNSSFAELRRVNAPSVLVEIAYHDNPTDAEWIKNNIDLIGRTLALSVTEFLGVPFIEPSGLREGVVTTGGGRLNIRTGPSLESTVIGQIPNGTRVTITGQEGDWYTVSHNGLNGYVYGQYITLE